MSYKKLERKFMESWKRFDKKTEYSFDFMFDLFMKQQLPEAEYRRWKGTQAIDYSDVLLEKAFVPDMEEGKQPKTMIERIHDEDHEYEWWKETATHFDEIGHLSLAYAEEL